MGRRWRGSAGMRTALVAAVALLSGACSVIPRADGADRAAPDAAAAPPAGRTLDRYAGYRSEVYADPAHWVCRPGAERNACTSRTPDATAVAADGTLTVEPWTAPAEPPADCFYVYPTVSLDPGERSDLDWSMESEGTAAFAQVSRLEGRCRIFAPAYHQFTIAGVKRYLADGVDVTRTVVDSFFDDVVDAFRHYMANDNQGRPVVLIGHSQGAMALMAVLRSEFDPHPDVRDLLVAAYLPGSNLTVPEGADVGGDLATVPLCRRPDQTGCAVAWSSYRDTAPPGATAAFGRTTTPGRQVACVNPARLAGGRGPLRPYFAGPPGHNLAMVSGGALGSGGAAWVDAAVGRVTTAFATTPGLVDGACVSEGGASYLAVTVNADPADPRADDIGGDFVAGWGQHLNDVSLVLGDIDALIGEQTTALLRGAR